jgi:EAL domain-containing protein (putative c-di-GMP-specific phosphodiesterase class I)/NO-binding membrane sensor protein with MHYT domain
LKWLGWIFLTGLATGAGIWATHFVAMFAFKTGLPTAYDPLQTLASLLIAIGVTGVGFLIAGQGARLWAPALGGVVIGLGIAAMHYTGMRAFKTTGTIDWDNSLVVASIVLDVVFAAAAMVSFHSRERRWATWSAAGLLTVAICSQHFTAMGAAIVTPDPTIVVYPSLMDNSVMALTVAGVTLLVILAGLAAALIDKETVRESVIRLHELADAAAEGIVVAKDGEIMNVNRQVSDLSERSREELLGKKVFGDLLFVNRHSYCVVGDHRIETVMGACFFEQEMDMAVRRRRKLTQELRVALADHQFELYYQPQVKIPSGEILGFEALLRWHHPEHGLVAPNEFIPLAEETGLIAPIGEWVLETACREAALWPRPYKIAINLSPRQFQNHDLPEAVHRVLVETGLSPARLELEITETTLFEDLQRALDSLRRLRALGVSIAMDDFGTGYSSLSSLQAFPFDKIKIDQQFVVHLGETKQAAVIVRSVLGLGKSLDILVLAEGVETQQQLEFLNAESCEEVQGFYFGRPAPTEHIRKILASGQAEVQDLAEAALIAEGTVESGNVTPIAAGQKRRRRLHPSAA